MAIRQGRQENYDDGRMIVRFTLHLARGGFLCHRLTVPIQCSGAKDLHLTPEQSRNLKLGQRVSWQGDDADRGVIVERDWTGVRIKWDNGKESFYHHNDMREIASAPLKL